VLIVTSSEFACISSNGVLLNSTDTAVWLMYIKASRRLEIKTLVTVTDHLVNKGLTN